MQTNYQTYNEDCIIRMHKLREEGYQADLSIFSPPFASLYAYSGLPGDMGNSRESDDEFLLHYEFFTNALFPLIKPGRNVCLHIQQVSRFKGTHGFMGLFDIRGAVIRKMEEAGFIYYGETTIPKNPQAQSIRTKSHCLTFSSWEKDSTISRPALGDYLLIFKVPGDNQVPVHPLKNGITRDDWIKWADMEWQSDIMPMELPYPSIVWDDINETFTLNTRAAKDKNDERHVCPLQLDLIERCVLLWSNAGEEVFSPFAGIGSEGYMSLRHGRKFTGIELKESYHREMIKNLDTAIKERIADKSQLKLFA